MFSLSCRFSSSNIYAATSICLDVVETMHQTVVQCTVGSILQSQNKIEKIGRGWGGVSLSLVLSYVEVSVLACRVGCLS